VNHVNNELLWLKIEGGSGKSRNSVLNMIRCH